MSNAQLIAAIIMLLVSSGEDKRNPWADKVPAALRRAGELGTVDAYRQALDVTWRADDWQAGRRLAEQARRQHPTAAALHGLVARAYWRAGDLEAAEEVVTRIAPATADRVAAQMRVVTHLARGERNAALRWTGRLEKLGIASAEDCYLVFAARFFEGELKGAADLLRQAERLVDPANGYPDIHLEDAIDGLATYFAAVGPAPLNQVAEFGTAPMRPLVMFNLPSCEVFINGHGPYRMILDTGGSILMAIDEQIATDVGLATLATGVVRGVSGKEDTGQVLVERLEIGGITCKRIMTRTMPFREKFMNAADGLIGTGIFADARMTIDFANQSLTIAPSTDRPAAGTELDVRIVGDAKVMALATVADKPVVAMLDTGADIMALSPSRLKTLFPDEAIRTLDLAHMGVGIGGEAAPKISLNPSVDLTFGGRDFDDFGTIGLDALDTLIGPIIGVQSDLLVGMPLFRQMASLTVDFPRCKTWVQWLER